MKPYFSSKHCYSPSGIDLSLKVTAQISLSIETKSPPKNFGANEKLIYKIMSPSFRRLHAVILRNK